MPRKFRRPKARTPQELLGPIEKHVVLFGAFPDDVVRHQHAENDWAAFELLHPGRDQAGLFPEKWAAWREALLADWIRERPGTRPYAWWLLDAPRERVGGRVIERAEPRRYVRGCGRVIGEGVYPRELALRAGAPPFVDIDPNDPPFIESEAAYLRRHAQLTGDEQRRLDARAFEAIAITTDSRHLVGWITSWRPA